MPRSTDIFFLRNPLQVIYHIIAPVVIAVIDNQVFPFRFIKKHFRYKAMNIIISPYSIIAE